MSDLLVIMFVGILTSAACALNGSLLVLRKQALTGDAIAHAVLPGIVLIFLWTGWRESALLLPGAGMFGAATVWLTNALKRSGRAASDSALGIVFTTLFALGVVLISYYASDVDLDQDCVLYGEIAYTPWDRLTINGFDLGPRAIWILGAITVASAVFIGLTFPVLSVFVFDERYGTSTGMPMARMQLITTLLTSVTIVAAFESVGAILVVALLIIPPATALLFAHSLKKVLVWSVLFGVLAAVGGTGLSVMLNSSISAAIACVAFAVFLGVFSLRKTT